MESWKNIRLELAPTEEFPSGSVSRGYLIRLPLDDGDNVDPSAFDRSPHRATVRRYWSTEPDDGGRVLKVDGSWTIRCNGSADRLVELDGKPLRLGQKISVVEPDGAMLPFRVACIR